MSKRLYKSRDQKVLDGVCGGLAEYFHVDAVLIRVLWVILSVFVGEVIFGILAYLIAMVIMPAKPIESSPYQHIVDEGDGESNLDEQEVSENRQKFKTWLGVILIGIGGGVLFERIFSIDLSWWLYHYSSYLWPLGLILLGILLLTRRNA